MGTISFELKGELSPYNPSGEILLVLELDKHTDL
jgi:hypothetical protein